MKRRNLKKNEIEPKFHLKERMCVRVKKRVFPSENSLSWSLSQLLSRFFTSLELSASVGMRVCLFIIFVHIHKALASLDYCIHGGSKYRDGDYFRPNGTIMKTDNPQQCVQCRCHEGLVICEIEKCPLLNCEMPVQEPDYCCQRCPEVLKITNVSSDFSLHQSDGRRMKKSGCASNGKYYADGSVWQPVIGPLGVMSCVQCRCDKGVIMCKRYQCKELPCSHPQKEFGKCCRVCPNSDSVLKGAREECLPKSAELFVLKTSKAEESSPEIEYAFLEGKTRSDVVQLHSWNTRDKGTDILTVRTISHKEFVSHNKRLLGATSYRRFRKYSKREEKLRMKCLVRCVKKILRLEKALKIYPVNVRNKCNEDELTISNLW